MNTKAESLVKNASVPKNNEAMVVNASGDFKSTMDNRNFEQYYETLRKASSKMH